jgi:hypothetical protein
MKRWMVAAALLVGAGAVAGRAYDAGDAARWSELEPVVARNGMLRLNDGRIAEPGGAAWLADQLRLGEGDPATRRAWAEAYTRLAAEGDGGELAGLLAAERDRDVRHTLLDGLRWSPPAASAVALRGALAHVDPTTRAHAAFVAAGSAAAVDDALVAALADPSAQVRAAAVRALGVRRADAWAQIEAAWADPSPEVRVEVVRALRRLDPARAEAVRGWADADAAVRAELAR